MTLLLELTVKVSLIILVALAATVLLRRQSAAVRQWLLSMAIVCAAAVPAIAVFAPAWHLPVARTSSTAADTASTEVSFQVDTAVPVTGVTAVRRNADDRGAGRGWWVQLRTLVIPIWIAGIAASLAMLLAGLRGLAAIVARSQPIVDPERRLAVDAIRRAYGIARPVRLLETDRSTLLVTWGLVRPIVLLPEAARTWPADRVRVVLAHELAHIRHGDWAVHMIAEILRAAYWFNPLLWIACRALREQSERACDDAVLNSGVERTAYATHLLDVARACRPPRRLWLPAPAIAHTSNLERRITAMLNVDLNRRPPSPWSRLAIAAALFVLTLPIAGVGAQTFGALSGTIADPSGAVLPNATLKLTNVENKSKYEVRSDRTGRFEFVGLTPGDYTFEADYMGFAPAHDRLAIAAGQTIDRPVTLQVGSLMETITVDDDPNPGWVRRGPTREEAASAARKELAGGTCGQGAAAGGPPVGGSLKPPTKIFDVRPQYPPSLRGTKTKGTVVLEALIGTDGVVKEVRATSPSNPDLENAAIAAVNEWQFTPTLLNCVPVEVRMTVHANFTPKE